MPSIIEARVARARKIPYDQRDLSQAVSDFYLLETLGNVMGDKQAKRNLAVHETQLAKEFSAYLDIAVGGELRYARSMLGDQCPNKLHPFLREASLADRGTAWLVWGVIRRAWGLDALKLAEETFDLSGWRGGHLEELLGRVSRQSSDRTSKAESAIASLSTTLFRWSTTAARA